jgi:hypothetical protein
MKTNIFQLPEPIIRNIQTLNSMVTENPQYLSIVDVAKFLGVKPDGLRNSIDRGQCPFGFGWKINKNGNRGYKIPTVTFYLWYTQAVGLKTSDN